MCVYYQYYGIKGIVFFFFGAPFFVNRSDSYVSEKAATILLNRVKERYSQSLTPCFYSRIFLAKQKTAGMRPV